jgi:hypothetical protein
MSEQARQSPRQNGKAVPNSEGPATREQQEALPSPAQLKGRPWLTGVSTRRGEQFERGAQIVPLHADRHICYRKLAPVLPLRYHAMGKGRCKQCLRLPSNLGLWAGAQTDQPPAAAAAAGSTGHPQHGNNEEAP